MRKVLATYIHFALVAFGILALIGGIYLNAASNNTTVRLQTQYPPISLTALLDAAENGGIATVIMPGATGITATAITGQPITTGPIVTETGTEIGAGEALNTVITSQLAAMTAETLTKNGVTVWIGAAPDTAVPAEVTESAAGTPSATRTSPGARTTGTGSPAAPIAGVPANGTAVYSTTPLKTDNGAQRALSILLILAGIVMLATGVYRGVNRTPKKQAAKKAAEAEAALENIPTTRFTDVAGATEAVEQLQEVVSYLKDADAYHAIGATLPKGALLVGPPGTGKTLLARAVAGEAGVPFFAASGSDFVEKYVGVGAQRVRALFAKARKHERSIVFIDEIDAVARKRSSSDNPSNQESENTLISLLAELDGFTTSNVVVIAATNRPDILDPALTRPGRLDRRVEVPLPDRRGRHGILNVHATKVRLADGTDLELIARRTPGFSGAQLQAVVNEAAMEAVRRGQTEVSDATLDAAVAIVAMGRARTSALVTDHDRRITAWHEAGHTVCALLLKDADPPVSVSIVPRGPAGGVTWMSGTDDIFLTRAKAHARLVVALGGRAAEQLLLDGEFTQGASGDLQSATDTALLMATRYGMTRLGLASRAEHLGGTTTKDVATVVEELLAEAHAEASTLISTHRDLLTAVAHALLEHEDLDALDLERIALEHGVTPASRPTPLPAVPDPREIVEAARPRTEAPTAPVQRWNPDDESETSPLTRTRSRIKDALTRRRKRPGTATS